MTPLSHNNTSLKDLAQAFLLDPFVQEQSLPELNLEEIGSFFEGQQEELHTDTSGFERTKSQYCLILLELELLGYSKLPEEPFKYFFEKIGELSQLNPTVPNLPSSPLAKGYFELGESIIKTENFPLLSQTKELARFQYQCQIWAIECELYHRLRSSLVTFWPQRRTAVSQIICLNGNTYGFHPELNADLEKWVTTQPNWLYEKRFPFVGILSSLKYILSVTSLENFAPICIDFATLILFFGREADLGSQKTKNFLRLEGLKELELLELFGRLSYLQRLKAKILNPHQEISPEDNSTTQLHIQGVFSLIARMKTHSKETWVQEVA